MRDVRRHAFRNDVRGLPATVRRVRLLRGLHVVAGLVLGNAHLHYLRKLPGLLLPKPRRLPSVLPGVHARNRSVHRVLVLLELRGLPGHRVRQHLVP